MSACATTGGEPRINPLLCAAILGGGGWAAGNAVGNHNDRDHLNDRLGYVGAGAVAGAALGYVLCNALRTGEGQAPSASASANPTEGMAPLTVEFRGSGTDPDGQVASYAWDLGDGTTSNQRSLRHVYREPGNYTARLKVTDDKGLSGSDSVKIKVAEARADEPAPKVEKRIVLRGVQFDFDSAEIRPEAEVILDEAARVLRENRKVRVEIAGHTDSTGPEAYNQALSERRAASVKDYLVAQGVDADRLSAVGFGESQPVADNGTRDGRAQNRRVELNVLR
jgi:outer membrane protein OmpA-like peptidoglycan-associated protein